MFGKKKEQESPLDVDCSESENGVVLTLNGRLDSVTSAEFLDEFMPKCRDRPTVLDMAGLSYISSAGLRAILSLDKATGRDNGLTIVNAEGAVRDVLDMSGFGEFLGLN